MGLRFSCPCGRPYNLKSALAGRFVRCKTCEELIEVPAAAPEGVEGKVIARLAADVAKKPAKRKREKAAEPDAPAREPDAPESSREPAPEPERAARKDSARFPCEEHPHKAATGACDGCGRRLCSACLDRLEDTNLCRACLLKRVEGSGAQKGIGKKIKKITDWFRKAAVEPTS